MSSSRGTALGWIVAFPAFMLMVFSFLIAASFSSSSPPLRSEHAAPAKSSMPDGMPVIVSHDGKTFHARGCTFIHDKEPKTISSGDAVRLGYSPCVRCLRKYAAFGK